MIFTHNLGDGVRLVLEWECILMGSYEVLFLQMQPYLISHLKLVWYPMLIVALLVLSIIFLKNIMNLLLDVLDSLKKIGFSISLGMSMGGLFLCNFNGKSYANGDQWLELQAHLKRVTANKVVEGSVVAMLNIRKDFIPCVWMFKLYILKIWTIIMFDYLCFSISMWVEGSRFGHLGVHHQP
jgi:hypothetical protein